MTKALAAQQMGSASFGSVAPPPRRESGRACRTPCRVRCLESLLNVRRATLGETTWLGPGVVTLNAAEGFDAGSRVEIFLPRIGGDPQCVYGVVTRTRHVGLGTFEMRVALAAEAGPRFTD